VIEIVEALLAKFAIWLRCKLRLCDDCPHCETYVCPSCFRRLPWSNGCADDLGDICDDCWAQWAAQHEVNA